MDNQEILKLVSTNRLKNASERLTPFQAKLYSQNLLKKMGQEGLHGFSDENVKNYLEEALTLIHFGLIEKKINFESNWKDGIKRGAEILEWLSYKDLNPNKEPFHLLAAAAYQLAGFPALALGLLRSNSNFNFSLILKNYYEGNFAITKELIINYWQKSFQPIVLEYKQDEASTSTAIKHVIMCIGVMCEYFETGIDYKVERALKKLEDLAKFFILSKNEYSWLLSRLTFEISNVYYKSTLWNKLKRIKEKSSNNTIIALNEYSKSAFLSNRSLIWESQSLGIEKLLNKESFVLSTPTGSGKTTIAVLAAIQCLYEPSNVPGLENWIDNLVLYLVPSRALASEVEEKLTKELSGLFYNKTIVTGLYGGNDWGPTDAWISQDNPTVLVCTYEKADALIRYLGIFFLSRVRLIVIDEIHSVETTDKDKKDGITFGSRSFNLEMLITRILMVQESFNFRVVGLSAVAKSSSAISKWISKGKDDQPNKSNYRSTRQMIGRLEMYNSHSFKIEYDLMNGKELRFEDSNKSINPYIFNPFKSMPTALASNEKPIVRLRAPTFWAALNLVAHRNDGTKSSVMISITQNISSFSETCLNLLKEWPSETIPDYFKEPVNNKSWNDCLTCAKDYFSEDSFEYQLLKLGILVHHGKMPTSMARRLKKIVSDGLVNIVIATSTFSEGVNIPINYILLPSVRRGTDIFPTQEFKNLVGRAGRPGVSTEGHVLVMLPPELETEERRAYNFLVKDIQQVGQSKPTVSSSLEVLLSALKKEWERISKNLNYNSFESWLEQTISYNDESLLARSLDSLDAFIITTIQEIENIKERELNGIELEFELKKIWQSTYAQLSIYNEEELRNIWLMRGKRIKDIYPNKKTRFHIYKTSLAPRSALMLMEKKDILKEIFESGRDYIFMDTEQRLSYISEIIVALSSIPAFRLQTKVGRSEKIGWERILRWWFAKETLTKQPSPKEISKWYEYVNINFVFKTNWGLGSLINLLMENASQKVKPIELDDWEKSGLPWIVFWLKELFTWGTLDPVAAYLLAKSSDIIDRNSAVKAGRHYYDLQKENMDRDGNSYLDPRKIRNWAFFRTDSKYSKSDLEIKEVNITLEKNSDAYINRVINVYPLYEVDKIIWIDSAGYKLARSEIIEKYDNKYEFQLHVDLNQVLIKPYLLYN